MGPPDEKLSGWLILHRVLESAVATVDANVLLTVERTASCDVPRSHSAWLNYLGMSRMRTSATGWSPSVVNSHCP